MKSSLLPLLSISCAIFSRAADFVLVIMAARLLEPFEFGAFTMLMVGVGLVNAMVSGGGDMWLNRFTQGRASRAGRAPRIWRYYLATSGTIAATCLTVGAATILAVRSGMLTLGQLDNYYFAAAIAISMAITAGFSETLLAIIRAAGQVVTFFIMRDLLRPFLFLTILMLVKPGNPDGVMLVLALVWIFILILAIILTLTRRQLLFPSGYFHLSLWRRLWAHTGGLVFGNLSSRLSAHIDVLVLMEIVGLSAVGEYRAAAQFAIGFMVVQHFVFLGLPWQIHQSGDPDGQRMVRNRQILLLCLSGLALLVLSAGSEYILLLLGERFIDMVPVFILFLCIRFSELLWGPQHEILISNGRAFEDALANLTALAGWLIAFLIFYSFADPLPSAIAAAALASLAAQAHRYMVTRKQGLRSAFGHGLGPALPVAANAGITLGAHLIL